MKSRVFLEVVPAAAAGQLELAELVAGFAEQRLLLDRRRAGRRDTDCRARLKPLSIAAATVAASARRRRRGSHWSEGVISWGRQALRDSCGSRGCRSRRTPTGTGPTTGRGKPQLLRELVQLCRVAQVRGEIDRQRAGSRGRTLTEPVSAEASRLTRMLRCNVAADRSQFDRAEIVAAGKVIEQGLVSEMLAQSSDIASRSPRSVPAAPRGELVVEEVVEFLAVEAVRL